MREILFRAKDGCAFFANTRLVRRWAYGYLCDRNYIGEECRDEYGARYTSETLIDREPSASTRAWRKKG